MEFTARKIAEALHGTVDGNPEVIISKLAKIEEGEPGTMTFLANPHYTPFIYTTKASIVVVNQDFIAAQPITATLIRVENAYEAFVTLLEIFNAMQAAKKGISELAFIHASAVTGKDVYIGEFVYIGENVVVGDRAKIYPHVYLGDHVTVGEETILFPGVKVYHQCVIGKECTLHAGVVIGADGFGFAPQQEEEYRKVIQAGNVVIEDHVEIGANTTIDRATLGSTLIHSGVKLDNLIQIAHNVEIGENTVIAAQTGVAGSTKIGKNCMIAGQVGIVGHLTLADHVKIGAQSGIEKNIPDDGAMFLGSPAIDVGIARKNIIHLRHLDELVKRVNHLEKLLKKEQPE